MAQPEESTTDRSGEQQRSADRAAGGGLGEWVAASALRISLVVVGFVILLFALGQAAGVDLIGMVGQALNTQFGRWLVVAIFGLLLIMIALRGFGSRVN